MNAAEGIVFLTSLDAAACAPIVAQFGAQLGAVQIVRDLPTLVATQGRVLFAYATSVIVPPEILARYQGAAYNLHAASPQYPGRDPHHWAVYDGVTRYGATLHVMTPKVDAGAIIDVAWFDVAADATPQQLLLQADAAALRLIAQYGALLGRGIALTPQPALQWGGVKRTRADFLAMCCVPLDLSRTEFERRVRAFDDPNHANLTVALHDRIFRLQRR
jgi:methionyl-tRNA formyltransferase